jgi:hypothetical protein
MTLKNTFAKFDSDWCLMFIELIFFFKNTFSKWIQSFWQQNFVVKLTSSSFNSTAKFHCQRFCFLKEVYKSYCPPKFLNRLNLNKRWINFKKVWGQKMNFRTEQEIGDEKRNWDRKKQRKVTSTPDGKCCFSEPPARKINLIFFSLWHPTS